MDDQQNGGGLMPTTYTAGSVLSAVEALDAVQQTFTRAQVGQLIAMAYDSGRTAGFRADLAELHSTWEDRAERRKTYEEKVSQRLAEMEHTAEMARIRAGRPVRKHYLGGPVEWGDVDAPYDVLTEQDRRTIAAAMLIPPVGSQAQPGTRQYAEGWREMRSRLTPWQWSNLTTGEHAPIGARTLAMIRDLDQADRQPQSGARHLRVVKDSGRVA